MNKSSIKEAVHMFAYPIYATYAYPICCINEFVNIVYQRMSQSDNESELNQMLKEKIRKSIKN